MITDAVEYKKIVDHLIKKSFPELKKINVRVIVEKLKRGSMRATRLYGGYLIIIDPEKYEDAKDNEIIGAIAHELTHFEDYSKKSWIRYFFWFLHYKYSKSFMRDVEIKTDKLTIQRGYARELYSNRCYRASKSRIPLVEKGKRAYLTPEEIKLYAKEIGKW